MSKEFLTEAKKHEYRRLLANREVNKLVIYCTAPVKAVVGEVAVVETISDTLLSFVWAIKDVVINKKYEYTEGIILIFTIIMCAVLLVLFTIEFILK